MNISIFGLGYVGIVSAACLASRGNKVIGVDINPEKVLMLNEGISPIVEKNIPELLAESIKKGNIVATSNVKEAILKSELSLVCVGTPSRQNGSLDTQYISRVCKQISNALKNKCEKHIFVFRSTLLPGSVRNLLIPILEKHSGKKEGVDFFVAFNPEFLRESTAVDDFLNPPKTVIGCDYDYISDIILSIYEGISGPKIKTRLEIAEMVKYVDNNFHALKITFANEIGNICKSLGFDSHDVMNIFIQDTKLNISKTYLKPGLAFGGSCLPKDLRAINYLAKMNDIETPLLTSLLQSNNLQIINIIKKILNFGKKKIGIAGFSFKAGSDDLRESPVVEIIETLLGKGFDLKLYDKNLSFAKLFGGNKRYINNHIPHVSSLMVNSLDELIKDREIIVIGNKNEEFKKLLNDTKDDQIVFDLVRIGDPLNARPNYQGIFW